VQNIEYFKKLNADIMCQDVANAFYSYLLEQNAQLSDIIGDKIPYTALQNDMTIISQPSHERFLKWLKETQEYENSEEFKESNEIAEIPKEEWIKGIKLYELYTYWAKKYGEKNIMSNTLFGMKIHNANEKLIPKKIVRNLAFYNIHKIFNA
jgi:phage/plasmid-associated DNA primase